MNRSLRFGFPFALRHWEEKIHWRCLMLFDREKLRQIDWRTTSGLKRRQRVDLIAADDMPLMSATATVRGGYEGFTAISRALKQTPIELSVSVLVISQTSRNTQRQALEVGA